MLYTLSIHMALNPIQSKKLKMTSYVAVITSVIGFFDVVLFHFCYSSYDKGSCPNFVPIFKRA